jgi:hypothetical protein
VNGREANRWQGCCYKEFRISLLVIFELETASLSRFGTGSSSQIRSTFGSEAGYPKCEEAGGTPALLFLIGRHEEQGIGQPRRFIFWMESS